MPDIGATLREARTRARLDLTEVETATKIRTKYLRAIENEEWDQLPGPTFVKSFLRTYAEYLGIDARMLVEEYKLRHEGQPEQELAQISPGLGNRARPPLRPPRLPRGWGIGLGVVGVLALLIVLGSIGDDQPQPVPTATRPAPRSQRPAPAPPRPTRVTLRLVPTREVYVCLRNAQDELVVNETLAPGSESETYRSRRFRLTLGNDGVELRVNGRNLSVPSSAEPINYELTPDRRRRLSADQNAC